MKWFEGSINDAIATSKSKNAIFVVFIAGKDDTSTQVAHAIDTTDVSSRLEQESFVAIRLESGTQTYRFFAQIYQLVPIPSLFFIGENGTPLEIIAGNVTGPELVAKIDSLLSKNGKENNINKAPSTENVETEKPAVAESSHKPSSSSAEASSTSNIHDVPTGDTPSGDIPSGNIPSEDIPSGDIPSVDVPSGDIQNNDAIVASPAVEEAKQETSKPELTAEEKVERAKQLIELQRKQRLEEEERKEKERELERRKVGRDMQKLKQKQQDLEIKQAYEERMREKAAEAAAKEKVRQQIAQDKLERKQRELALQQQVQQQQQCQDTPEPHAPILTDATVARIQFRLPSGNPHMGQFEPTSTLRSLRNYVIENIDLPFRQFAMSTSFPRRELSNEDNDKTLLELELVPTAVILILPLRNSNVTTAVTSTQNVGSLSRFMWTLFAPIIVMYQYIMGFFSGGPSTNTESQRTDNTANTDTANIPDGAVIAPQNSERTAGNNLVRRNVNILGGATIRAQGNIHRLHTEGDDNDENNTWNGNSTQQM